MSTRTEFYKVVQHPECRQGVDCDGGGVFHRHIFTTDLVPHILWLDNVGLPCSCSELLEFHFRRRKIIQARSKTRRGRSERDRTEGGRGRDDPIAGGEGAPGDGGADGVNLADALVPSDGGGEGRPDGVDALDAVDVGGVDGGGQHPDADVALPNLHRRNIHHP